MENGEEANVLPEAKPTLPNPEKNTSQLLGLKNPISVLAQHPGMPQHSLLPSIFMRQEMVSVLESGTMFML